MLWNKFTKNCFNLFVQTGKLYFCGKNTVQKTTVLRHSYETMYETVQPCILCIHMASLEYSLTVDP